MEFGNLVLCAFGVEETADVAEGARTVDTKAPLGGIGGAAVVADHTMASMGVS